ncbi:ABC transporter ATP-binding protein [Variovorax humicola]|uniref:ABC transporter ATP-binding protein n=1 Tax=Variovorax humicola TaxID=1769758 RepID=A0ABU8W345_9BURK
MTPLLQVKGLRASYRGSEVLHGVDLSVPPASIVTLLGANGAGKTTTLRALCRMIATSGQVRFEDRDVSGLSTEQLVRLGIAHVPDGRGTFAGLTAEENLQLGGYVRKDKHQVAEDRERIYGYFPRLRERRKQQAGTLSGGEQQMLAIGRALMLRPKLLLLDEPSFGLAPLVVREIFSIMRVIREREGVSILLVEQNASIALGVADQAYLIETGRIVLSGSAADIKQNDAVRRSYLGE